MKDANEKDEKRRTPRQMAFRQEAMDALMELKSSDEIDLEKAMETAKLDCKKCYLHEYNNPKSSNCRDNPYCIQRLGLEKLEKLEKTEQKVLVKTKETQKRRDLNDQPAGLVNSGNFCYVNSALQVWFNVPEFRQIVYDFRPSEHYVVPEHPKMNIEKVMLALQELFYTMENTPFDVTDKNNKLIQTLRLNSEQQDTQEFTLMLFNALDRNLLLHPNGKNVRNRLNDLYTGTIKYKTFCTCGQESFKEEPCTSLQLNIANHNTLMEALDGHFGVDTLEDYKCSNCGESGNVARQCGYVKLPPVVLIQINRYAYDQKGRRKLKKRIEYPKDIPASAFIREPNDSTEEYELFAVMIHEGNNTHFGHYYDLVRNPFNRKWYKYNDERVEQISKQPGTERITKGTSATRKGASDQEACYGLLYMRKTALPVPPIVHPPMTIVGNLKKELEESFLGMVTKNVAGVKKVIDRVAKRYEQLKLLWEKLESHEANYEDPSEIAFLPTDMLSDILAKEYDFLKSDKWKNDKNGSNGNDADGEGSPPPPETPQNGDSSMNGSDDSRVTRSKNGIYCGGYGRSASTTPKQQRRKTMNNQVAETLATFTIDLCPHGKMSIDTILYGDVKAVSSHMTNEIMRKYDYRLVVTKSGEAIEKNAGFPTGSDICVKCVQNLRDEANFTKSLNDADRLAKKVWKEVKTRCSVKGPLVKPDGHVYIAKTALLNYRRDAQHERRLRLAAEEESAEMMITFIPNSPILEDSDVGFSRKQLYDVCDVPEKKCRIDGGCPTREYSATELPTNLIEMDMEDGPMDGAPPVSDPPVDEEVSSFQNHECSEPVEKVPTPHPCSLKDDVIGIEFNRELRCAHGGINYDQFRNSASPEEWKLLTGYFQRSYKVLCTDEPCSTCYQREVDAHEGNKELEVKKQEVRRVVVDIVRKIDARSRSDQVKYAVCNNVVRNLRNIKSRRTTPNGAVLCQNCALCVHGKPFLPLVTKPEANGLVAVTEDEWQSIVASIKVLAEGEIEVRTIDVAQGSLTEFCDTCYTDHRKVEEDKCFVFDSAEVYVRVLTGEKDEEKLSRRVAKKNVYKTKMSSSASLLDLKVYLYQQTGQTPMDQLLYKEVGGEQLINANNHHTLEELRIPGNNQDKPLILIAQEVVPAAEVTIAEQTPPRMRDIERGFGDTALAH